MSSRIVHQGPVRQILVLDDEPEIRMSLIRALNIVGYRADQAATGEEALVMLSQGEYDVLILDMQLPGVHGLDVLQRVHLLNPELQTIILTGNATLDSAIMAVRMGAADYLVKPVRINEIIKAVTQALQKRESQKQKQRLDHALEILLTTPSNLEDVGVEGEGVLEVPPLMLSSSRQVVQVMGTKEQEVDLTRGETAVLGALMRFPNKVLSCRQIARVAWGYDIDEIEAQNIIRPYVSRLRKKVEIDNKTAGLIQTVRNRGYRYQSVSTS